MYISLVIDRSVKRGRRAAPHLVPRPVMIRRRVVIIITTAIIIIIIRDAVIVIIVVRGKSLEGGGGGPMVNNLQTVRRVRVPVREGLHGVGTGPLEEVEGWGWG